MTSNPTPHISTDMSLTRRHTLQTAGGLGLYAALVAVGLVPAEALASAPDRAAFQATTVFEALKALGVDAPVQSQDIVIEAQEIAENGAVVPVTLRSAIPGTEFIALLVDKNPNALAGTYTFLDAALPEVGMRIKMNQSADVTAIVRAGGRHYMARRQIKVTIGGCGF